MCVVCSPTDTDTLKLMATPRCSLPDIVGGEDMLKKRRRKRYALSGLQWDKKDLTWRYTLAGRQTDGQAARRIDRQMDRLSDCRSIRQTEVVPE